MNKSYARLSLLLLTGVVCHISAKTVAVTNMTGYPLHEIEVRFLFQGKNDIHRRNQAHGTVHVRQKIADGQTVTVDARQATHPFVKGNVVDHFSNLTGVKVVEVEADIKGALRDAEHTFKGGTDATEFVAFTKKSEHGHRHYCVMTREDYNKRGEAPHKAKKTRPAKKAAKK